MRLLHFLIGAMVLITTGCAQDSEGIYNGASQYRDEIFLADPTILREGDMYYLTGTARFCPAGICRPEKLAHSGEQRICPEER